MGMGTDFFRIIQC